MRKFLLMALAIVLTIGQLAAQDRSISGKVTDANGNPVSGASVLVKGTRLGTSTDAEGNFTLRVPNNAKALTVSAVGFGEQDIRIGNGTLNIKLSSQDKGLEEVVVVAYGTQKKRDVAASITTVGGAALENKPFTSVDQMLNGKVSGLQAPSLSGQPGANVQIRIRGIGSITGNSNPLFVVDGVAINSGDLSRLATTSNALAGINANDIETVTVLKDAQATSLYGSRGANGVILITTKKGKAGKTRFRADAEVGQNRYANFPDAAKPLRKDDWLMLLREGLKNAGYSQAVVDGQAALYGEGPSAADIDWLKLVTRTGTQQQYNLSASGGDAKTTFYISGGYFNQQASVIGSDFKRYSATANFKHNANDKLSFLFNVSANNTIQNTPSNGGAFANPILDVLFLRPTQNPYNADGTFNIARTGALNFSQLFNPFYLVENDQKKLTGIQVRPNFSAEYSILRNLKFTTRYGIDYNALEEYNYNNPFHGDGRTAVGRGFTYYTRYFNWVWANQLDYSASVDRSGNLKLDAKVVYEAQKSKGYFLSARTDNFPYRTDVTSSANASTVIDGKLNGSDYDFSSLLGSLSLNYKDRYVLSGSLRSDASSRFSPDNRFGTFWSVGAAWNIDREDFFTANRLLSTLKLRGSYGRLGNAAIPNYGWRTTYGYGFNYNSQPGGAFNNPGNRDLTWEGNKQLDIGVDAGLFNNRVNVIFDYYNRTSDKLLFDDPLSRTSGFNSVLRNIGELTNKGYELTIDATPIRTKDFSWNINFNITHNTNKITKLPGGNDIIDGSFIMREGYDYRTYYAKAWAGVNPATGDAKWYTDGTHKADTTDYSAAPREVTNKSASPKYYGGLSTSFTFKDVGLAADFIYNYGNYVNDAWIFYLIDGANPTFGKYAKTLERWQKPGDVTDVPKYVYGSSSSSSNFSTRFLQKGDYIRLRNITVSYTVSQNLLDRVKLNSVRFYVRGTNLWTKTYDKNLTVDPEQGVNAQSNLDILYTRSFTAGINIGF